MCVCVCVRVCTRRYVLLSSVACSLLFHVNAEYTVQYICQLDSDIELPGLLPVHEVGAMSIAILGESPDNWRLWYADTDLRLLS